MIPDTLFGYPIVTADNVPAVTPATMVLGPAPWIVPRPTRLTVYDFQFNVLREGKLKWEDHGDTWRAKVEWEELPEEEEG